MPPIWGYMTISYICLHYLHGFPVVCDVDLVIRVLIFISAILIEELANLALIMALSSIFQGIFIEK